MFFAGKNRRPYVRIHMDGNSIPRSHSTRSTTEDVNSIQDIYALILLKNEDAIQMVYTWYIIMYRILTEFMPFTASKGNFVMFNILILNLWY